MAGYRLIVPDSTYYAIQAYCAKYKTSFGKFVNEILALSVKHIEKEITPEQMTEYIKQCNIDRKKEIARKKYEQYLQRWNKDISWYKKFKTRLDFTYNSKTGEKHALSKIVDIWKNTFPEPYLLKINEKELKNYDKSKLLRYPYTRKLVKENNHYYFVKLSEAEGEAMMKKLNLQI